MKIDRDTEQANRLRWAPGTHGHYEVYYLTLNHARTKSGFWIRYTMTAPETGHGEPYAQMWFSYFNYREPASNFGLTQKFLIQELQSEKNPFSLRIGNSGLSTGRAAGRIAGLGHSAAWNLNFNPCDAVHHHLPSLMYKIDLADTIALSPHLNTAFTGTIEVDGKTLELKNEPGDQTHLWGGKHAERWAWAHCNCFEEDHTAVLEGLSVQVKRLGLRLPPLNLISIRFQGREYRFIEPHTWATTKSSFELGLWRFRARAGNIMFRGELSCRVQDMICAPYRDPDGDPAWCHNCEVGHAAIRVYRRTQPLASWKHTDTLTSLAGAHVEFAGRHRDPAVRTLIEEIP